MTRSTLLATLLAPSAMLSLLCTPAASAAADDPYAALKLYEGKWIATSSEGKATPVENRCARAGLFFSCEQIIAGKTKALVVFMPDGPTAKGQAWLVQTLGTVGERPGPWRTLTIEGDRWVYRQAAGGGEKARRTVDQFLGPDHIHFEVQQSASGESWTTTSSGDERRAP